MCPSMNDHMLVGTKQFRRERHALPSDTRTHLRMEMNDVPSTVDGRSSIGSDDEPAVLVDAVGDAFHTPLRAQ